MLSNWIRMSNECITIPCESDSTKEWKQDNIRAERTNSIFNGIIPSDQCNESHGPHWAQDRVPSLQKHPCTKLYENQERKVTEIRSPVIEHHAYVNLFGNKKWEETNLGENGVHGTIWGQGYVSMWAESVDKEASQQQGEKNSHSQCINIFNCLPLVIKHKGYIASQPLYYFEGGELYMLKVEGRVYSTC